MKSEDLVENEQLCLELNSITQWQAGQYIDDINNSSLDTKNNVIDGIKSKINAEYKRLTGNK